MHDCSTKHVLVMEFVNGVKITDVEGIKKMGFKPEDVSRLILENFADQVFVGGFLHGDPHAGNVFVRPVNVRGRRLPQMVLLDHGLYQDLKPSFRDNYARLWRALVVRDVKNIEKYARNLGAGDYYKIFSFILTFRPFSNTDTGLSSKVSKSDFDKLKQEWDESDPDISKLLESLDRELLLVLRSATILRSINIELGGVVNRYVRLIRNPKFLFFFFFQVSSQCKICYQRHSFKRRRFER